MKKKILVVLGTRPEAIKLAPVILELRKDDAFLVHVCNTEQQKELSNQTLNFFGITPNFKLNVMTPNQSLSSLQCLIMSRLNDLLLQNKYDAIIVQGDTMTVFAASLVAFYQSVPIFHVEAGLRSHNLASPFPEEAIRKMVSNITALHFAPTEIAVNNLLNEGVGSSVIHNVGNTVLDALLHCLPEQLVEHSTQTLFEHGVLPQNNLPILVTIHRRENHGSKLIQILQAISELAQKYSQFTFICPVHPNPNVKEKVESWFNSKKLDNVKLVNPLDYPDLVAILRRAKVVLTDSGGIQEEACAFNVPIVVLRDTTERMEGVQAGFAFLAGTETTQIVNVASPFFEKPCLLTKGKNPYGDGQSSIKIRTLIREFFQI